MDTVVLPDPRKSGGQPLLDILAKRETNREMKGDKLSSQEISDLLWAAFGINRPGLGKRTAPSAKNSQEIDIYVALEAGLYLYKPDSHTLQAKIDTDLRAATGNQDWVADVPLNLIYVVDTARMGELNSQDWVLLSAADTGLIAQNVYLFCISEGLATVVRGDVNKKKLAAAIGLDKGQSVVLAQSVGYPR